MLLLLTHIEQEGIGFFAESGNLVANTDREGITSVMTLRAYTYIYRYIFIYMSLWFYPVRLYLFRFFTPVEQIWSSSPDYKSNCATFSDEYVKTFEQILPCTLDLFHLRCCFFRKVICQSILTFEIKFAAIFLYW